VFARWQERAKEQSRVWLQAAATGNQKFARPVCANMKILHFGDGNFSFANFHFAFADFLCIIVIKYDHQLHFSKKLGI
jgi:hypothetical protein